VVRDHGATHENADDDQPQAGDRESERAASRDCRYRRPSGDALTLGGEARAALPVGSLANDGFVALPRDDRQPISTRRHQIMSRLTAMPTA
jgi:hypothetical protein